MKKVQKFRAKRQVADILKKRNEPRPMVSVMADLSLNSDLLGLRECNARHSGKQSGPYKLLNVEIKTCILKLPSSKTNFRITTVKPYLEKLRNGDTPMLHDLDVFELDLSQPANKDTNDDSENNID